jgi:signal transduction histidine kinase
MVVEPAPEPLTETLLHRQVEDLQAQLAHARKGLEEFNYAIAHDLRAPLRHVRAYLQIVQEDFGEGMDATLQKHLHTVDEAATQMAHMVDALLELSRLRQAEVRHVPLDLPALLEQARDGVEAADALAAPRMAPLQWQVAPCPLRPPVGDPELVLQVLQRILSNAAKFTRRHPSPCVEVTFRTDDPAVDAAGTVPGERALAKCAIHIRDNGAGFDPRQADGLFKVFQRLHAQRDFEGLGAGLAYAQLALQRMGGELQLRSAGLEAGCEARITLPLADAAR